MNCLSVGEGGDEGNAVDRLTCFTLRSHLFLENVFGEI